MIRKAYEKDLKLEEYPFKENNFVYLQKIRYLVLLLLIHSREQQRIIFKL